MAEDRRMDKKSDKKLDKKSFKVSSNEQGEVRVADQVLAITAGLAATEVEGVRGLAGNVTREMLAGKLGLKSTTKGVRVTVMDGEVMVDLAIVVAYEAQIPELSSQIQERVKTTIESMTSMKVAVVNVKVVNVDMTTTK